MPSAGSSPASPSISRPSVFLSYASDDRVAARALRDVLAAAGLEVWYDENELGGGDAWDQKIRRQIRDCDYFMALVSAATERRKEGYFRREWRLAAERTMDMADDVLFLLPVVIDDTSEAGARVPEKFMTVQWLRASGGQRTPALDALMGRLLAGEHTVAPARPPLLTRPTAHAPSPPAPKPQNAPREELPPPPPMPPFPHAPHDGRAGHWFKFIAEVLWWGVTAVWSLFIRLPRWLRIILAVWLVLTLLGPCRSTSSNPRSKSKETPASAAPDAAEKSVEAAAQQIAAAMEKGAKSQDWGRVVEDITRRLAPSADRNTTGKPLVLAPLAPDPADPAGTQFAQSVFASCYGKLLLARPDATAVSPTSPLTASDEALATLGKTLRAEVVLGFRTARSPDGNASLSARLVRSVDGIVIWSGDYPMIDRERAAIADKIAEAVITLVPKK